MDKKSFDQLTGAMLQFALRVLNGETTSAQEIATLPVILNILINLQKGDQKYETVIRTTDN